MHDDGENTIKYDRVEVRFHEIESLSLSFQNIKAIKNLVGLERLTTLKLDNNTITRRRGARREKEGRVVTEY